MELQCRASRQPAEPEEPVLARPSGQATNLLMGGFMRMKQLSTFHPFTIFCCSPKCLLRKFQNGLIKLWFNKLSYNGFFFENSKMGGAPNSTTPPKFNIAPETGSMLNFGGVIVVALKKSLAFLIKFTASPLPTGSNSSRISVEIFTNCQDEAWTKTSI